MEMNDYQIQQARFALDERIIMLLRQGRAVETAIAYEAYVIVGGYLLLDTFEEFARRTR